MLCARLEPWAVRWEKSANAYLLTWLYYILLCSQWSQLSPKFGSAQLQGVTGQVCVYLQLTWVSLDAVHVQ